MLRAHDTLREVKDRLLSYCTDIYLSYFNETGLASVPNPYFYPNSLSIQMKCTISFIGSRLKKTFCCCTSLISKILKGNQICYTSLSFLNNEKFHLSSFS